MPTIRNTPPYSFNIMMVITSCALREPARQWECCKYNIHRFALQPIGQTGAHHCRPLQENGCVRDFDPTLLFPLQRQRKEVRLVFYEHFFLILILQNVLLGISRQNCQNQLHFFLAWFLLFPNLNSFSSFVLWSGGETPYSYSRANAMTLNCQRRQRFFRIRRSDQKLLQWECWQ